MYLLFNITAKQISIVRGVCYESARKEMHKMRDALSLAEGEPLMLRHAAAYWGFCPQELAQCLYSFGKK